MVDLSQHIAAKSDQLNADDLMGGPVEWTVEDVRASGSADQPIEIKLREWPQPWKPCKTMRRLLVDKWGRDGKGYIGRRMKLFRDPDVLYGGIKVGGIRIESLSHMSGPSDVMLTERRGRKRKFTVTALANDPPASSAEGGGGQRSQPPPPPFGRDGMGRLQCPGVVSLDQITDDQKKALYRVVLDGLNDEGMERADRLRRFEEDERGVCMDAGIPPAGMQKLAEIAEGLK